MSNSRMKIKSAIQKLEKLDCFINETETVKNKLPLDTKVTILVKDIKENDVDKVGDYD